MRFLITLLCVAPLVATAQTRPATQPVTPTVMVNHAETVRIHAGCPLIIEVADAPASASPGVTDASGAAIAWPLEELNVSPGRRRWVLSPTNSAGLAPSTYAVTLAPPSLGATVIVTAEPVTPADQTFEAEAGVEYHLLLNRPDLARQLLDTAMAGQPDSILLWTLSGDLEISQHRAGAATLAYAKALGLRARQAPPNAEEPAVLLAKWRSAYRQTATTQTLLKPSTSPR